ncbi:unnamed protein product [Rotaria magnacalcarata]|uniref:Uncharacterized protein n=1 Tax=Rotaria magnacalcarata TaxID=392030 RepID=A0A819U245_9BILA|nr:unnamed protein product [Rotaria magnacalcarata]CAF4216847.1 unnamed protein product [Rotaria magnacalcarata]
MHYLPAISIAFLGSLFLIVECNAISISVGNFNVYNLETNHGNLDCSKFKRDLDVLRQVEELSIYHQINVPLDVFCLVHLHTRRVNGTPFIPQYELDDDSISIGLSLLVSRLTRLRVVSLVNTTSSYIPPQALAVLINMTVLEIESCGLYEIPSTISLLTKLQQLRLSKNHLRSATHSTAFKQMSKLMHLDLSHNYIRDIADIADIPSRVVATMDFSYNQIDHIPPEIGKFYFELYYLYLNDNKLANIPTDIFLLKYLKRVDLQRNPFPADEATAIKTKFQSTIPNCLLTV